MPHLMTTEGYKIIYITLFVGESYTRTLIVMQSADTQPILNYT